MNCGGLIMEPGKVYAYAGKVCGCTKPAPASIGHVVELSPAQVKAGLAGIQAPSSLVNPIPAPGSMTATEFVHWLRGYAVGAGALPLPIHEALQKVRT